MWRGLDQEEAHPVQSWTSINMLSVCRSQPEPSLNSEVLTVDLDSDSYNIKNWANMLQPDVLIYFPEAYKLSFVYDFCNDTCCSVADLRFTSIHFACIHSHERQ